jgi:hypothetical protein
MTASALLEKLATAAAVENKQILLEILGDYASDPYGEYGLYEESAAGWLDKSVRAAVEPLSEDELWELITHAEGNIPYFMEMRYSNSHTYSKLQFLQEAAVATIVDRALTLAQESRMKRV